MTKIPSRHNLGRKDLFGLMTPRVAVHLSMKDMVETLSSRRSELAVVACPQGCTPIIRDQAITF